MIRSYLLVAAGEMKKKQEQPLGDWNRGKGNFGVERVLATFHVAGIKCPMKTTSGKVCLSLQFKVTVSP